MTPWTHAADNAGGAHQLRILRRGVIATSRRCEDFTVMFGEPPKQFRVVWALKTWQRAANARPLDAVCRKSHEGKSQCLLTHRSAR